MPTDRSREPDAPHDCASALAKPATQASGPRLRIGIDASPLSTSQQGIGRYVHQICLQLDALMPEADFVLYSPRALLSKPPSSRWTVRVARTRIPSSNLWLKWALPSACAHDALDVFWGTRTLLPASRFRPRTVCTVHDLNVYIAPRSMPWITRWSHRMWFSRDVRRATAVVAVSAGTAARLDERLGVGARAVARPGVSAVFTPDAATDAALRLARLGVHTPYFLAVGTLEPRKNLATLIEAFTELRRAGNLMDHALLLVGGRGWSNRRLRRMLVEAEALGVRWLGRVSDEDLATLYAACTAFVFPSLYEGFGIPAAEALACGARVIASDLPELREATQQCAHYIAPDRASIADALRTVALDAGSLPAAVPPRSWHDAAVVMAEVLRDVAHGAEHQLGGSRASR